jgi:hypothetical protein
MMRAEPRLWRAAVLLLVPLFSYACGDSSGPGRPSELQLSQLPAAAAVGATLSPSVTVLGSNGQPMSNVAVSFQVTGGGGSVSLTSATTDASGRAAAGTWTLGSLPGANTLVATASGLSATFSVQTSPGSPASLEPLPGVPATATVGEALAEPPGVRVRDQFGNAVPGVQVLFGASTGTLVGATQTSDTNGEARVTSWQLGTTSGPQTWNVQAGFVTAVYPIQVAPAAAASLTAVAGNNQRAVVNREVAVAPSVALRDAFGNGIANAPVTFDVAQGGGTVTGSSVTTDMQGVARVQAWRLGTARENLLVASSPGVPDVLFNATAEYMLKIAGDNTTCPVNTTGCSFGVRVFNTQGEPAGGQVVTWLHSGGATATTTSNMNGFALAANLTPSAAPGQFTQAARFEQVGEEHTFNYSVVQGGGFNIDIRFTSTVAGYVLMAFDQARLRWQQVITGNLPSVALDVQANSCLIPHPAVNEIIDDILIFVQVVAIDGLGGVLGSAGPCWIRSASGLPIMGVMRLDEADLESMNNQGFLVDVILHEIGHVLGLGSLWHPDYFDFVEGRGGADPRYTAPRAVSRFTLGGGHQFDWVPVENAGGAGSRDSHWRETQLGNELMTSRIGGGVNPLSAVTIGALLDMGYEVNFGAADPYSMPGSGLEAYMQIDPNAVRLNEVPMPPPRRW